MEYEVDCIIYASGFEVGTESTAPRRLRHDRPRRRASCPSTGPTACGPSTASTSTASPTVHRAAHPGRQPHLQRPHNLTEAGETIALIVGHALEQRPRRGRGHQGGRGRLDRAAARRHPARHPRHPRLHARLLQQRGPAARPRRAELFVGYPGGATAYFQYIDEWRNQNPSFLRGWETIEGSVPPIPR